MYITKIFNSSSKKIWEKCNSKWFNILALVWGKKKFPPKFPNNQLFKLLWRDYFKFVALKHGNDLFQLKGLRENYDDKGTPEIPPPKFSFLIIFSNFDQFLLAVWLKDPILIKQWAEGVTGYPFVDANMKEVKYHGNASDWNFF